MSIRDPEDDELVEAAKCRQAEIGDNTKPGPANDTASKATPEIGAIERAGDHKGEIYGGIFPVDQKPIWFSQFAPKFMKVGIKLMNHFEAAVWATAQGGSLPTREQGDYLDTIKDEGAFKTLFNRSGSFPAGHVWLAEPYYTATRDDAWCQRLSDGEQSTINQHYDKLPVLSVQR